MVARDIVTLLKDTFTAWSEDKASRLAAALAYYTVFSLAPLLVLVIAIAGQVLGPEAVRGEIVAEIGDNVGEETAAFIESLIANAREPSQGIIASIVGVVTLLLGASGVFGQLQGALDTVWHVEPAEGRGIMGTIQDRFLGFALVLGIGFLLMVTFVVSTAITAANNFLGEQLPAIARFLPLLDFVVSIAVITILFAVIFKMLPRVHVAWQDVWLGAAFTAFLFTIGKLLIGWYLGTSGAGSAFGAAGSLIVLLLWIYYSAQIFLLGAEFTRIYANRYGSQLIPEEDSVRFAIITEEDARLETVAATLAEEEVQLMPVPAGREAAAAARGGPPGSAPQPASAYRWAVAIAASFVAGLLISRRN